MITCYTLANVPPFAQGLVRDLRVRWACEEAGEPYRDQFIDDAENGLSPDEHRALQPFGQVPAISEDGFSLFESGAIVLRIGERSEALLPKDPDARSRAIQWMFAALNTIEPQVQQLAGIDLFFADADWAKARRQGVVEMIQKRFAVLESQLNGQDYLEPTGFSAGDLLMTTVLRFLRHTDIVEEYPALAAYKARCEARPAFRKALADQMAAFEREPVAA